METRPPQVEDPRERDRDEKLGGWGEKTCQQRQEFRKKERRRQEMGEIERERKPGEAACGLKILK